MQNRILEKEIVFINVIKFLRVEDFINLSICNNKLIKFYNKSYIWKEKNRHILRLGDYVKDYKNQYIINYGAKHKNKCSICNQYIIQDFYILMHDCNYGFIDCVKCLNLSNECGCGCYTTYHTKCLKMDNPYIVDCPLCNQKVAAYHINFNI